MTLHVENLEIVLGFMRANDGKAFTLIEMACELSVPIAMVHNCLPDLESKGLVERKCMGKDSPEYWMLKEG